MCEGLKKVWQKYTLLKKVLQKYTLLKILKQKLNKYYKIDIINKNIHYIITTTNERKENGGDNRYQHV